MWIPDPATPPGPRVFASSTVNWIANNPIKETACNENSGVEYLMIQVRL
uniref:Uncharacterized protein n=1 Tax=Anguilla anguilla TaxID=7936 RepID=A0A0E9VMH8_ANGAN